MDRLKKILASLGDFFRTVLRSCYDMELYREVRTRPWTRSLAYYFLFIVFITAAALAAVIPSSWSALKQARQYIADKVPAGASVAIRSGKLETSLPSPTDLGTDKLALIIDAAVSGMDAQPVIKSGSGFVFGRDVIVIKESAGERRVMSLADMPDLALTKDSVLSWFDRYGGWLVAAAALGFVVAYVLTSLSGGVAFILMASLVAALFGSMWRARLRFSQWVAVGFHAITLPLLANMLFDAFGLNVPMVFTLLYFMVIVAVIADERASPTAAPAVSGMTPPVGPVVPRPAASEGVPAAAPAKPPRTRPAGAKPSKPRARKKPPVPPDEKPPVPPPQP